MNQAFILAERYFSIADGELMIGGLSVKTLVKEFGSPLFVYDNSVLNMKWELLRNVLPKEINIYYSVKANPNPAFLKFFVSKGAGLEVASDGEIFLALKAGCPNEKIIFAGPGKTLNELEYAVAVNIGEIHAESLKEIDRIQRIARSLGMKARVALRINPDEEALGGAMVMGGKPTQFGIDEENLDEALNTIMASKLIEFTGIHIFSGTQILNHKILIAQYRKALEICRRVVARIKRPLRTVDFGGGLGIPYFANEQELNMESLKGDLSDLFDSLRWDRSFEGTQFIIEPGRYLIGEAGVYITQVTDIKLSRGKKYIIVDGGMNHHLAASGNLGQVIRKNFPVAILNKLVDRSKEKVDIVGPLCTPLDVLARDIILPKTDIDDLVGVFQSGAYARTASPLGFLSHSSPPEIMIYGKEIRIIRRRGENCDLLKDIK